MLEKNARKPDFRATMFACFLGYIVQAVVNNFTPLLFLQFQREFGIPLSKITLLITFNFVIQLIVDTVSPAFVDKIGYRVSMILADGFCITGFILLAALPGMLHRSFAGILIAVMVYAVGGGLLEVLVSPIVEACPTKNKETAMSLLHSFYCWGQMGVILFSTIFFSLAGISNWRILTLVWIFIPLVDLVAFLFVPIAPIVEDGEEGLRLRDLFKNRLFLILMLMMFCAGACELSVSQWASAFAEKGLGISKTLGDLAGSMFFAFMMAVSRTVYGTAGKNMSLRKFMKFSIVLCIISYAMIVFAPMPALNLAGCGLCGFSVGIFWPGTFSMAAAGIKNGGTAMYALMALAGDMGGSAGPTLAGAVASAAGDNLKAGIGGSLIFPILMAVGLFFEMRLQVERKKHQEVNNNESAGQKG